jgi:hypothetical protein
MNKPESKKFEPDLLEDVLSIFEEEELIRFERRAKRAGKIDLARFLEAQLRKRGN